MRRKVDLRTFFHNQEILHDSKNQPIKSKITPKNEKKKFECQQHPVFPGGHPSKYWRGSTLLNFGDRTRTGAFSVIWPLTRRLANNQAFQPGPQDLFEKVSKAVHRWSKSSGPTTFSIMYCTFQCTKSLRYHLARQHLCKGLLQPQQCGCYTWPSLEDWTSNSVLQWPWIWTFLSRSWRMHSNLTLRSGDTVTNDRIERCCYC